MATRRRKPTSPPNSLAATSRPGGSITPSAEERRSNFTELVPAVLTLKNILVPTDFSEVSQKALEFAVPIAKQFGARITMVHVIEPLQYSALTYVPMDQGFPIQHFEEELNALAKRMIEPELLKEVLVRAGPAFEEITNVARDCEADLIVITTHGRTGIRHVVMGSTAERTVRHAPCPVLVVRKREHEFV
jgi:universal stress protein A